jgi:ribonuclease P protein component
MLPKQHRLSPKDFQRLYKAGFKVRGEYGMLIGLREDGIDTPKAGIVVNTKVGNAVVRHRTTRQLREVLTKLIGEFPSPLLYEYISFKAPADFKDLEKEVQDQFKQILERLK